MPLFSKIRSHAAIVVIVLTLIALATRALAQQLSADEERALLTKLREQRAQFPALTADFTEERTTHLLNKPIRGTGIPVRQFGRDTEFSTGPAMLAHHTGAAVIPAFVIQQPDHRYRAIACPPVEMAAGPLRATLQENTQRIANVFEVLIREHPDQWFNYAPLFQAP